MEKWKIKRRDFMKTLGLATLAATTGRLATKAFDPSNSIQSINKRQAVLNLINSSGEQAYIPTGFFVHFGEGYQWGDAAVKRHLEYFNAIDMDFVKIQFESLFPAIDIIKKPSDWSKMPFYQKDFYEEQLYLVKNLVKQGKKHAPVIATYYSPFMCAGHSVTSDLVTEHLKQDPDLVMKGMEIITDSVMIFVKECKKLGVDGFLAPTQGNEAFRFEDPSIFLDYIKPSDLMVMNEINQDCVCNILHICDYEGAYDDLSAFSNYPGHIVNLSNVVAGEKVSFKKLYELFGERPIMGGLDKRGIIMTGSEAEIVGSVERLLDDAPPKFILGAECALLGDVDWQKVRTAVDTAHSFSS